MTYREIGYTFDDGSRVIETTPEFVLVMRAQPYAGAWYEVCDHDGFYGACYWELETALRMLRERTEEKEKV